MLQVEPIEYVTLVPVVVPVVVPLVEVVPFVIVLVLPEELAAVVLALELLAVVLADDEVVVFEEDELLVAALMDNTRKPRARTVKIDLIVVLKIIISFLKSSTI